MTDPLVPSGDQPSATDGRHKGPLLVQAPIRPLDEDGMLVALVGTALWLIGTLVMVSLDVDLRWIRVGVAGVLLGLLGTGYIQLRRSRARSRTPSS